METKNERFKRIAQQRTNKILDTLRLLGNCSNKNYYDYSEEEVRKIFKAIDESVNDARQKFKDQLSNDKKFKL